MKIGNKAISRGRVYIIAEAGVNHNGKLGLAFHLVDAAHRAGADAVKFQNFKPEEVVTADTPQASYQRKNSGKKQSQLEMIRGLALSDADLKKIAGHAKKSGITFLSTPHGGFQSADLLQTMRVPAYKIGSGDLTNIPLLAHIAKFKKPIILSTGMATIEEVSEAVAAIRKAGNKKIVLLQCTTDYPTRSEDVNLRAMCTLGETFGVPIGFSDHTKGDEAAVVAVALGATVIEKHLTLDKTMPGPDHRASADVREFTRFVKAIRKAEVLLGSSIKKPSVSERPYIPIVRKSVVAARAIQKGEKFSRKNLVIKRPGTGLHPRFYFPLLRKKAKRDLHKDQILSTRDL